MSFRDQDFNRRFEKMGDEAEGVFEQVAKLGFARFGLSRPPVQVGKLPDFVRYTPDYLQTNRLVEVQGCGQDGMLKFKLDKLAALSDWNEIMPVCLFVWDRKRRCYAEFPLSTLIEWYTTDQGERGTFPEGKAYFGVSVDQIEGWVEL